MGMWVPSTVPTTIGNPVFCSQPAINLSREGSSCGKWIYSGSRCSLIAYQTVRIVTVTVGTATPKLLAVNQHTSAILEIVKSNGNLVYRTYEKSFRYWGRMVWTKLHWTNNTVFCTSTRFHVQRGGLEWGGLVTILKSHENIKFVNKRNYISMVGSHRMERYNWTHFNNKTSLFWLTDLLFCWDSWSRGSEVGWNKGSEFVNKLQKFGFARSKIRLPIFF